MFLLNDDSLIVDIQGPEYAPAALRQLIADKLGNDPGDIIPDGGWHKFRTRQDIEKDRRTGCGTYRMDLANAAAIFGSHRPGEMPYTPVRFDFAGKTGPDWQATAEVIRQQAEAHIQATREQAAADAVASFQAGAPLTNSVYLRERGVLAVALKYGKLRMDAAGTLLIPMVDGSGTVRNLQTIRKPPVEPD